MHCQRGRNALVLLISVMLLTSTSACGFNEKIVAPPGWSVSPQILGSQKITNPADAGEYILIAHPREALPAKHPATERWTLIRICGDHPATLMERRGEINGEDVQMDGVDTTWNGARIMAMYARPYGKHPNAAAERTIRTLCVGPS
jgi:hypothetical protein